MTPFTGKTAALFAVSFLVASVVSACGPAEAEAGAQQPSGTPSASVSSPDADPATPESEPSGKPSVASGGDGSSGDGSGDGVGHGIAAGRTTTAVVPLGSEAVAVDESSGHGLSVKLTDIERTEAEPSMPGEIAGPAVRVEVAVINSDAEYHALGASVVNLYYGPDRIPASSLSGSGEEALPDSVPGGQTVTGTYEFAVPDDRTERVLVEIDVDPQLHVALFEGEISP
ncbi:hypothetical protein [Myceligenerans pegani]|uniref:DUF4352 domain-containing protein n=1 Tax=Myceligenerans pegani TaxID=2776917 RepID=A0ABR9MTT0_9MICO|nr:hypothetical protein [Myceligenerans sp. TRM 65318]MBE1874783.1 hypothetical protein [Myceligenerans sp. TRM 65318]MBE3017054.1 hypothetical protein [Myceligenerans sp. TRM 65318]